MAPPSQFLDLANPRSEAQKKRQVLQAARQARRTYRQADTQGERFERWIDQQIARKTRIMPGSVAHGATLFLAYFNAIRALESSMADLMYMSSEV